MLNLHLSASEKEVKCPFSLVPMPLSPLLYLTPYVDIKHGCMSCVLCFLSSPLAMDEFCTPFCILSFIDLKEQDENYNRSYFNFLCITLYPGQQTPLLRTHDQSISAFKNYNYVSETDMKKHKSANGSGGFCTDIS